MNEDFMFIFIIVLNSITIVASVALIAFVCVLYWPNIMAMLKTIGLP